MWKLFFEGIWLLVMSISDIRSRRIPLWMIGVGIPVVVVPAVMGWNGGNPEIKEVALSVIPGALLLLMSITRQVGYGDGLVVILFGLAEGKRNIMRIFCLSFLIMSVSTLILLMLRRVGRNTRMPYLPFLLMAWLTERIFL